MRSELYTAIKGRLEHDPIGIKHIDLWNNHTENIGTGDIFPLPAVFIEFAPIDWRRQARGQARGDLQVSLHIITRSEPWQSDSKPVEHPVSYLELLEQIQSRLIGLCGKHFSPLQPTSSETDHNARELLHSIESFVCQAVGLIEPRGQKTVVPVQLILHGDNSI
ncbi:hypothetical protein [Porphyromonas loveana]|uniref:hypothetical protein n=1 Tax=Porphyromonas loveana TaxID=1884669 RepID=UPI0035A1CE91